MGAAEHSGVVTELGLQHPDLRNFKKLTKDGDTRMVASLPCQKPQFLQWKKEVQHLQEQSDACQFLLLPLSHSFDQGGVCSTAGQLTLEFDYYPKLLSVQIRDRFRDKNKFTEAELWYLLYVLVAGREALVGQGYQVGDIQPRNIFLNANQQVKVACILSWPGQVSAYRKAALEQGIGYLAPEDIVRLKLGAMDNKDNTQSEIYSMGLTMLSASILQPMKDIYSTRDLLLDEELFGTRLTLFQQDKAYSDIYRAVVCNLLELDTNKRMNQSQLSQFLFKHRLNLQAKKTLMFDNVGRKLQQSINVLIKINAATDSSNNSDISQLYPQSRERLNQESMRHSQERKPEKIPPIPQQQTSVLRQSQSNNQRSVVFQQSSVQSNTNAPPRKVIFAPTDNTSRNYQSPPPEAYRPPLPEAKRPPIPEHFRPPSSESFRPGPGDPFKTGPHDPFRVGPTDPFKPPVQYAHPSQAPIFIPSPKSNPVPLINRIPYNGPPQVNVINFPQSQRSIVVSTSQEKPKHRPFEKISSREYLATPVKQESRMAEESSLQSQRQPEQVTQLLMETRRGGFVVQMSKVKRKDNPSELSKKSQSQIVKQQKKQNLIVEPPLIQSQVRTQIQQQKAKSPKQSQKQQTIGTPCNKLQIQQNIQEVFRLSNQSPLEKPSNHNQKTKIENNMQTKKEVRTDGKIQHKVDKIVINTDVKIETTIENKMSPSVKVWGVHNGRLTIQQVGSQKENQMPAKKEIVLQEQSKQENLQGKTQNIKSLLDNQQSPKQDEPLQTAQQLPSVPSNDLRIAIDQKIQQILKPEAVPVQQIAKQADIQLIIKQTIKADTYILIEQPSRRSSSVLSQNNRHYSYYKRSTQGSFQECWQEVMNMLVVPQQYCNKIDPQKVHPLSNEHGQFLKVGPAAVKVHLNKEQGKVWLENLPSSKCDGDFLCGVVKEDSKNHYIWFNSSLRFRQLAFPSPDVMDEALTTMAKNIDSLRTSH